MPEIKEIREGRMLYFAGAIKERSGNLKQGIRNSRFRLSGILLQKRRLCNLSLPGLVIMFYVVKNRFFPDGYSIIGQKWGHLK
ncbi:MAG TPA: hypothetical protein VMW72_20675 [Sedimentisphaerales bacterium]|nr:hypothetical protein [Sedimentisphaerales bacterium]